MKSIATVFLICVLFFLMVSLKSVPEFEPVAVIELFTSQGCSSCPAADRLLSKTIMDAKRDGRNVFALSFHVDYWNRLGWTDPFSDRKYSDRQRDYASTMSLPTMYTPQMIVNGSQEFVGSSEDELGAALAKSLKTSPAVNFKNLAATLQQGNPTHVKYELEGNYNGCKINFALVSLNETITIKRGENVGRILKNENVVRQFLSIPAASNGEVDFENTSLPTGINFAVIGYVQRSDLKIIGASMTKIN